MARPQACQGYDLADRIKSAAQRRKRATLQNSNRMLAMHVGPLPSKLGMTGQSMQSNPGHMTILWALQRRDASFIDKKKNPSILGHGDEICGRTAKEL